MKRRRVGVSGAGGRMGQEVAKILANHKTLRPAFGWTASGEAPGFEVLSTTLDHTAAEKVDVWIDFSSPEAFGAILEKAVETRVPLISGTTGFPPAFRKKMERGARKIPILWASNMSMGVAILNEALQAFSKLEGFDFQVEEVHHRHKKDKPSGTALTLQRSLEASTGRRWPEPLSIRGGGVFGIHKVWALSEDETLVFEHTALNRAVFARGAVRAAAWIVGRRPGLYEFRDTLFVGG